MAVPCLRGWSNPRPLIWLAAALISAAFVAPAAADPVVVSIDQATVMKLPERAATVIVGNPLIADLSVQPTGFAVVTGKGYGATNVIVMDNAGAVLMEKTVEVRGPSDIVVVYRGPNRETFSCTPDCSRRITLGDFPEFFEKSMAETVARNNQATAAAATTGH